MLLSSEYLLTYYDNNQDGEVAHQEWNHFERQFLAINVSLVCQVHLFDEKVCYYDPCQHNKSH